MSSRSLYLHIGAPKTGTTFLQSVLRANKDALAGAGLCYPGNGSDHFLGTLDLLERRFGGYDDPRTPGSWQALVDEVERFDGDALISHELLSSARADQVATAVGSFPHHQVHVVYTARDLARQLPAVWQERIKNRAQVGFDEFFTVIRDRERADKGRRSKFWSMQDAARVLESWATEVPPDRIHVVTVPPKGAPRGLLLERFLGLVGVDPSVLTHTVGRGNESLGAAEASVLRRLNQELDARADELPWPFYSSEVKFFLANDVLAGRRQVQPIELSPEQHAWADAESRRVCAAVAAAGYDVVGDLDELLPVPYPEHVDYRSPDTPDPAEERDAAILALAGLLARYADREQEQQRMVERVGASLSGRPFLARLAARVARIGWVSRLLHRH